MTLRRPPPTAYASNTDVETRLRAKPKFAFLRSKKISVTSRPTPPDVSVAALPLAGPDPLIDIDPLSALPPDSDDQDQYQWAVVYENQRGLRLFSSLYYSHSSLLPTDPAPFTTPQSSLKRSKNVTLAEYSLPDGSWRWVSVAWMVDMSGLDSGQVQHDGFEYNFMFRAHHWRSQASAFSWVRRRKWLRLMMRPARANGSKKLRAADSLSPNTPATPEQSVVVPDVVRNRYSMSSSFPPSVLEPQNEEDSYLAINIDEVWQPDDTEGNWERCRAAMRTAATDGRILELWRRWLGYEPPEEDRRARMRKQWTEDEDPPPLEHPYESQVSMPSTPVTVENITPALRQHADLILQSFIYPESRARFIQMLERVGVLPELNVSSSSEVEFWSYIQEVGENERK